jgi:hypothetical protein
MSEDGNNTSSTINSTFYGPGAQPDYDVEGFIRSLQRTAELSPDQIAAIRERRPVSPDQYDQAKMAHDRFVADRARVRRFFEGDTDVRKEVMGLRLILGSTVKAPG